MFYLYAMYVEFGIGEILEPSPLIYAITHQVSCPDVATLILPVKNNFCRC